MKQKMHYLNINSSYVKIVFSVMLTFVLCSIGLTAALFSFINQYQKDNVNSTNRIIFGVNTGILMTMLAVIIIVPVLMLASRKMISPLVEINKVAVAMAEGDFSVRAQSHYQGEIGQLAETLNQLSTELSKTINSLTIEKNLLEQILNSMSDGLVEFDTHKNVNLLNKPFFEMFEVEEYGDLSEEIKKTIESSVQKAIEYNKIDLETCKVKNKTILLSGSPIHSEQDGVVGAVMLFRDITEIERLEQTRRDYVANVSHELRSPLTAVKGLIIPLKEGMVRDEIQISHFYDIIYNEIERLNRLVNDLFELSRLQTWNKRFEMQTIDIQQILYDQQDKFLVLAEKKNIRMTVEDTIYPALAYGNIDRISQVLTILIDNALKFSKEGSKISLAVITKQHTVQVCVNNTGSYISSDDLPHIFDRFYKVNPLNREQGAGLGLSIAKEIMSRMNGTVYGISDGINETSLFIELKKVQEDSKKDK